MATTDQGNSTPPQAHPSQPRTNDASRLGELLVRRSVITFEQLAAANAYHKRNGGQLATTLVRLGFVTDDDLTTHLHKEYRLPVIDPLSVEPLPEVLSLIPHPLARKHEVMPISLTGSTLTLAMSDPSNLGALNECKFLTGCDIRIVLAPARGIQKAIERHYNAREKAYNDGAHRPRRQARPRGRPGRRDAGPGRPPESDGGSSSRQARQRADDRRGRAAGERHPHRALRERSAGSASGSTASSTTSCSRHPASRRRSPRASRSWPRSTSRSGACPRTARSRSSSKAAGRSASASLRSRPSMAKSSCCG